MKKIFIGLLCLFIGILYSFQIPYSKNPIKTDTNKICNFFKVSPPDSTRCSLSTNTWLWYDEKNLFIQFEAEIDETFVEGKHAAYDGSASADYVRVQLITDVHNYFAYGYYAYPLGSKYDFIRNSELDNDKHWNSRYSYTTEISDSLWKAIIKIPFSDLRHTKSGPYNWKIVLTRYQRKTRETFNAPFVITKMGNDYFRRALDIEIPTDIHGQKKFTFKPYTIFTYDLEEKKTAFDEENLGIDIAYNPTYSTRMKLSISPDYSDVPLDTVTDTYNSKYSPSYAENRYFFIEDFNAFGVGKELFYSRGILQPQYAFKLTSSNKNYSLGILSSMDKLIEEKVYVTANDSTYIDTINPSDMFNIIAFQPTWENIRCQFTLLNRINEDYHNEVLHINPVWEVGDNNYIWSDVNLSLQQIDETITIPENDSTFTEYNTYRGYYSKIGFRSFFRTATFSLSAQKMNKNYRALMGKNYEDDFYGWNLDFEYVRCLEKTFIKEIETSFTTTHEYDNESNLLLERYVSLENTFYLNHNIDFDLEFEYVKENVTPSNSIAEYTENLLLCAKMDWDQLSYFKPGISINKVRDYFYRLQKSYYSYVVQGKLSGIVDKYVSYFCSLDYTSIEDMPETTTYDDEYVIANFDLTLNLSNQLSLTNGVRYHDYEYGSNTEYLGYFSNFKWEINSKSDIFAGIKFSQDTINQDRIIDYNTFYLKLIYMF
jgi:hypothetical protein